MNNKILLTVLSVLLVCCNQVFAQTNNAAISFQGERTEMPAFSMTYQNKGIFLSQKYYSGGIMSLASINQNIRSLGVSGNVVLLNNNSFARVILVDKKGKEYLVYDGNTIMSGGKKTFTINSICEETCSLPSIQPHYLKVELNGAIFFLTGIMYDDKPSTPSSLPSMQSAQVNYKLERVKDFINSNNLRWQAGETSISKLSYQEKKRFFLSFNNSDQLPNLQGLDYYAGGVFEFASDAQSSSSTYSSSSLPSSWNWNNVHGKNWLTSFKDQGSAGTCWSFSSLGAMESQIRLHFNQPDLKIDLSEQMMVDCTTGERSSYAMNQIYVGPEKYNTGIPNCFYADANYYTLSKVGIADESCNAYASRDVAKSPSSVTCTQTTCANWKERTWKNSNYYGYQFSNNLGDSSCPNKTRGVTVEGLKKLLIENGPLDVGIMVDKNSGHAMVLVGYETDNDGKPIWVFKNSWGTSSGEFAPGLVMDKGYLKAKIGIERIMYASLPIGPFIPPANKSYWPSGFDNTVKCEDKDNDNYCYWGSSVTKPSSCPANCKDVKDCDDSNPNKQVFDKNYNCIASNEKPQDGKCGSAHGSSLATKPENNLCDIGIATTVTGDGPWTWTCQGEAGGKSTECKAEKTEHLKVDGKCGSADGGRFDKAPSSALCDSGKPSQIQGNGPWTWTCQGENGGSREECKALKTDGEVVKGECGSAISKKWATKPDKDLCISGNPTKVEVALSQHIDCAWENEWEWTCEGSGGGTSATCVAPISEEVAIGKCGTANGAKHEKIPNTGLCETGKASDVNADGNEIFWECDDIRGGESCRAEVSIPPCEWNCTEWSECKNNTQTRECTNTYLPEVCDRDSEPATEQSCSGEGVIHGECGSAISKKWATKPDKDLCSSGDPTEVKSVKSEYGYDQWEWRCNGSNGGESAGCSASMENNPTHGECGSAISKKWATKPDKDLCSSGDPTEVKSVKSEYGYDQWEWRCNGSNGGESAGCSAFKEESSEEVACGSANGKTFPEEPKQDLCVNGKLLGISGQGPWYWLCQSNTSQKAVLCSAQKTQEAKVDGKCGPSHKKTFLVPPTELCSAGKPTQVYGSGPWIWLCTGINSGEFDVCWSLKETTQSNLPDLIVEDIFYDQDYIAVKYCNRGSSTSTEKFAIKLRNENTKQEHEGSSLLFLTPEPGACKISGGFTSNLIGLKSCEQGSVTAIIDPDNKVKEANENNNTKTKQLQCDAGLPDLVIEDIYYDKDHVAVKYCNKGKGRGLKDFSIKITNNKTGQEYTGNESYKFFVPQPSTCTVTGGITAQMLDLTTCEQASLTAVIDWEMDVEETNEKNNTFTKELQCDSGLPDLIVEDIFYDQDYISVKYCNQGKGKGTQDFLIKLRNNQTGQEFPGSTYQRMAVPVPGACAVTGGISYKLIGLTKCEKSSITAIVDWEGRVQESNGNNNALTKTIECDAGLPDIVIEDITYENNHVQVKYCNKGTGKGRKDFLIKLKNNSNGKEYMGNTFYRISVPEPGQCISTGRINISLLGMTICENVSLTATADPERNLEESDPHNNELTKTIDCSQVPSTLPDLVVEDAVYENNNITIKYCNKGVSANGIFSIRLMNRTNGMVSMGNLNLSVPSSNTCANLVVQPSLLGTQYCEAIDLLTSIDPENKVQESNENNNEFTKQISCIQEELPDLVVKDIKYQDTLVIAEYCNIGKKKAEGFAIKTRNNEKATTTTNYEPSLEPGQCKTLKSSFSFTKCEPDSITVIIDVENKIKESNKSNNSLTKKLACAITEVKNQCGSANGTSTPLAPTTNLCSHSDDTRNTHVVSGEDGNWQWSCGTKSCTATDPHRNYKKTFKATEMPSYTGSPTSPDTVKIAIPNYHCNWLPMGSIFSQYKKVSCKYEPVGSHGGCQDCSVVLFDLKKK